MRVELEDSVVRTGDHVVQFYEHEHQLARVVGRYLTAAIEEGAVGLAIATEAHRGMLEAELQASGLDPEECRRDGCCEREPPVARPRCRMPLPVSGGVGRMTIAMLMANTVLAAERSAGV